MFANNTTIPTLPIPFLPLPAEGDGNNDNQFSLANLFGMFLTITICILAQPYGSLLYTQPTGSFGRAVFFFWRINPLACAAEALLILYALCEVAWVALTDTPRPGADTGNNQVIRNLSSRVHTGIAALLLVRKHSRLPVHWTLVTANEEQANRQAPRQRPVASRTTESSPSPPTNVRVSELDDAAGTNVRPASPQTIAAPSRTETETAGSIVPHDSRDAEDEEHQGDGEADPLLGRRRLRSALRRNIFANGELLVDVTTFLATGFVIIRLAATVLPWAVRVAAWSMIAGWIAVQIPVTLSHVSILDEVDMTLLVQTSVRINSRLQSLPARASILAFSLPTLLYVSYTVCAGYNSDESIPLFVVKDLLQVWPIFYLDAIMWAFIGIDLLSCLGRRRGRNCSPCSPCAVREVFKPTWIDGVIKITITLVSFLLGAIIGYVVSHFWGELIKMCLLDPSKIWACWLLLALFAMFVILWFALLVQSAFELHQVVLVVTLIWNLTTTILIFVGAMLQYAPEDTYKPDWLDWFGRRFKTFDISELGLF